MLGVERRQYILSLIRERGSISVTELSSLCSIGEETIRRDLNKMASEDLIEKIYGGATVKTTMHNVIPVSVRKVLNVEEKKRIAKCCVEMIEDGDTIFLDGSTTALEIAAQISGLSSLVIITNAAEIACRLPEIPGLKVICTGGTMRIKTRTFVGHSAVAAIEKYHADKAFICCDGADIENGITDASEQEVEIRKAMLRQSELHILAADNSKFDKTSFSTVTGFDSIHSLVTDQPLSPKWQNFLDSQKTNYQFCCKEEKE